MTTSTQFFWHPLDVGDTEVMVPNLSFCIARLAGHTGIHTQTNLTLGMLTGRNILIFFKTVYWIVIPFI